jgi:tRNA nucleotidyltransferase (CCA-adding enzyme)
MVTRSKIEEAVLEQIRPTQQERDHIWGIAKKLQQAVADSGKAQAMVVGSIARHTCACFSMGTWSY